MAIGGSGRSDAHRARAGNGVARLFLLRDAKPKAAEKSRKTRRCARTIEAEPVPIRSGH
jgi:hypothetical protein